MVSVCALLLVAATATTAAQPGTAEATEVELFFELKLLYRRAGLFGKTIVDQWAGGRLLARATAVDCAGAGETGRCGTRLELVRPLEDPWTFRWYDFKDEVKLGAAVWVREPTGAPYAALAPRLEPLARERYARWWDDDRIEPAGDGAAAETRPSWWREAERFWARAHAAEAGRKDPLHADPVYPFWVLGDPAGRLALEVSPAGAVVEASVVERMSEPWRPEAWSAWQRGRHENGYGYWERTARPRWEPRTYQAFAAAFGLLAWPLKDVPDGAGRRIEVDLPDGGLVDRAVSVVTALSPRAGGRLRWRGGPVTFRVYGMTAEAGPEPLPRSSGLVWRAWRRARLGGSPSRPQADEVWFLAGDPEATRVRLWIRVGYRPAATARPAAAAARPDPGPFEADSTDSGRR
jgi:hypothetical protein